jgi:4-phospho-D-threonate 3-dehydrogenase / 4-phospho-D-erythronate 3-dehydrogenase
MTSSEPTIAITMGDPAGIGPEVIVKALSDPKIAALAKWIVVGDLAIFERAISDCNLSSASLSAEVRRPIDLPEFLAVKPGQMSSDAGAAAVACVRVATELCLAGEAAAMVTAPLNKEAVTLSGRAFSGHTEYIAELCGARESRMLLAGPRLNVIHVSTHIPLRRACELDISRILRTIELGYESMRLLGHHEPRIVVCGLNPHAGEHCLFGSEDRDAILPAIEVARAHGIPCDGPAAPDTVFLQASRGRYDLVVAMYHDQGHIPMKLLDFDHTVNVSVGIPIIRTSVDHGTAFDIAGRNQANPQNMKSAMKLAAAMAGNRSASPALAGKG